MQCVILAAGKGTRMQPLTFERPKPLIEVAGKPILTHILDALPAEVDSLVFVVHYRAWQIRAYYGDSYRGLPITYIDHPTVNGTGGALLVARHVLHDRFMVMSADDLHGPQALKELAREPLAILGALSNEPQHFGVLTVSTEGTLLAIEEKPEHPKSNLVNTATMVLDERIFDYEVPAVKGEVRLTDMATLLANDVPMRVVTQPLWCPIGRPEDIAKGEEFVGDAE